MKHIVAFQGEPGAYSDIACRAVFEGHETLPCASFDEAFESVESGRATHAMIPIDNTLAGRVADVHRLLPHSKLYVVGEHFEVIRHALLGTSEATLDTLTDVYSHVHALPQCSKIIKTLKLKSHVCGDTAGAARLVAEKNDAACAAIASPLAAEIYDLKVLEGDVQDAHHNTTRFLILSAEPPQEEALDKAREENKKLITSFVFRMRNRPAALYKCLGGFATNGVNMTKLESYVDENFQAAQFFCDVEGHPDDDALTFAFEELSFFTDQYRILGTYPAHSFRDK